MNPYVPTPADFVELRNQVSGKTPDRPFARLYCPATAPEGVEQGSRTFTPPAKRFWWHRDFDE